MPADGLVWAGSSALVVAIKPKDKTAKVKNFFILGS